MKVESTYVKIVLTISKNESSTKLTVVRQANKKVRESIDLHNADDILMDGKKLFICFQNEKNL